MVHCLENTALHYTIPAFLKVTIHMPDLNNTVYIIYILNLKHEK